jgi:hypothetical protein
VFFNSSPLPISLKDKMVFTSEKTERLFILKINASILATSFFDPLYKNNLTKPDITIDNALKDEIRRHFLSKVMDSASKSPSFMFEDRMIFDEFSKIINIE